YIPDPNIQINDAYDPSLALSICSVLAYFCFARCAAAQNAKSAADKEPRCTLIFQFIFCILVKPFTIVVHVRLLLDFGVA
ncbi:MAG: hypothetical protein L0J37_13390, partial [Lactiplantibacillus plantarum]|nr:hypothetical protein [Lactiplantibacillus plantarum]